MLEPLLSNRNVFIEVESIVVGTASRVSRTDCGSILRAVGIVSLCVLRAAQKIM